MWKIIHIGSLFLCFPPTHTSCSWVSTEYPLYFNKYGTKFEYNIKQIILRRKVYKFVSLQYRKEKFSPFKWYTGVILAVPANFSLIQFTILSN